MANYPGADEVPPGDEECVFGKWGWAGRAFRDAERLLMNRLVAALVWLICLTAITTVFIVVSPGHYEGNLGKIATVVQGVVAGTAIGMAVVWLYGYSPLARRSHWRVGDSININTGGSLGVWVESRHWHQALNMRCDVTGPNFQRTIPITWRGQRWYVGPGDRSTAIVPNNPAGPTVPGVYRLRWQIDAKERDRPITIAQKRYRLLISPEGNIRLIPLRHPLERLARRL